MVNLRPGSWPRVHQGTGGPDAETAAARTSLRLLLEETRATKTQVTDVRSRVYASETPACVQAERPSYFSGRFSRPCSRREHRTPGSAFSSVSVARVGEHCRRGVVVLNLGFVSFP